MRKLIAAFAGLALLAPAPTWAQAAALPAAAMKTFVSSNEVARLIAKAKGMRRAGQALVVLPIPSAAPYVALLEYREAGTPPIVHEDDSELFFVIEGSGTMMLGGTLTDPTRVKLSLSPTGEPLPDDSDKDKVAHSTTLTGTGAQGGHVFTVSKGELVIVPPHAVHWFNAVNGTLVMVSLHATLPRYGR